MKPILYYYEHCPYCVRVLAVLQMANVDFDAVVLLNDDEATPIGMIGQKMLPIWQIGSATYLAESLDIIEAVCLRYDLKLTENMAWEAQVNDFLGLVRDANYALSMPRWVTAPLKEFATPAAVAYFTRKKTQTIGDFAQALDNTPRLIESLTTQLHAHASLFETLSVAAKSKAAILLFAGLYGLRYVEGFTWTPESIVFMQTLSEKTRLPL